MGNYSVPAITAFRCLHVSDISSKLAQYHIPEKFVWILLFVQYPELFLYTPCHIPCAKESPSTRQLTALISTNVSSNTAYGKVEVKSHSLLTLLNAELNPICHLLALLGAHHIFHVSGLRINFDIRWKWVVSFTHRTHYPPPPPGVNLPRYPLNKGLG